MILRKWLQSISLGAGLVAAAGSVSACTSKPTEPSANAPFSIVDLRVGSGEASTGPGSLLTVQYSGWFYDADATAEKGVLFDTSIGREPFSFTLGALEVIRAWDNGLTGMKVGGIRRIVSPPSYAYGDERNGIIPPNQTLVFEIELLAIDAIDVTP